MKVLRIARGVPLSKPRGRDRSLQVESLTQPQRFRKPCGYPVDRNRLMQNRAFANRLLVRKLDYKTVTLVGSSTDQAQAGLDQQRNLPKPKSSASRSIWWRICPQSSLAIRPKATSRTIRCWCETRCPDSRRRASSAWFAWLH